MAQHCKIKCKNEEQYERVRDILDIQAIEYFQNAPDKPIHLCGRESKKDVEKVLDKYKVKKYKVKVEEPDFDKASREYATRENEEEMEL